MQAIYRKQVIAKAFYNCLNEAALPRNEKEERHVEKLVEGILTKDDISKIPDENMESFYKQTEDQLTSLLVILTRNDQSQRKTFDYRPAFEIVTTKFHPYLDSLIQQVEQHETWLVHQTYNILNRLVTSVLVNLAVLDDNKGTTQAWYDPLFAQGGILSVIAEMEQYKRTAKASAEGFFSTMPKVKPVLETVMSVFSAQFDYAFGIELNKYEKAVAKILAIEEVKSDETKSHEELKARFLEMHLRARKQTTVLNPEELLQGYEELKDKLPRLLMSEALSTEFAEAVMQNNTMLRNRINRIAITEPKADANTTRSAMFQSHLGQALRVAITYPTNPPTMATLEWYKASYEKKLHKLRKKLKAAKKALKKHNKK